MPEPKSTNDILKQIQAAWGEAQAQLAVLREQVEHATQLAMAKVQSNLYSRDLDRAYRDLGELVYSEVKQGKFQLPAQFANVKKAVEQVSQRVQAQNASIHDLLAEGEAVATQLQQKMGGASKGVAAPPKKR
jgi:chromosome segregation ATPase